MNACVLTIGDELLQGFTTDTNSSWLGMALLPYGINISKKITIGDDINSIMQESRKILNDNFGKPSIQLKGSTANFLRKKIKPKKYSIYLSLSDDIPWAQATVIISYN